MGPSPSSTLICGSPQLAKKSWPTQPINIIGATWARPRVLRKPPRIYDGANWFSPPITTGTLKTPIPRGDRSSLPPIVNAQQITKAFGANPLFQNVSFTISDGDRIGLIGPNGSGKSTLLRILAGELNPDSGEVSFRKRPRLACVEQDSRFESGTTVR